MDGLPLPPDRYNNTYETLFLPDTSINDWVLHTFLNPDSDLYNPQHDHLVDAEIGYLWTNLEYKTKGRRVIGQAEQPRIGNKWSEGRKEQQLRGWFGDIPDFIITLDTNFWMANGNPERCALLEHELYHCAQSKDEFGMPRFSKTTGRPVYTIVGHDVEEFVGVVKRYGAEATRTDELVKAANAGPEIARAVVDGICGSCRKQVA